jgi:hypothetical protein
MVKDVEVVFGKGPGSQPIPSENGIANAIDMMHVMKRFFAST